MFGGSHAMSTLMGNPCKPGDFMSLFTGMDPLGLGAAPALMQPPTLGFSNQQLVNELMIQLLNQQLLQFAQQNVTDSFKLTSPSPAPTALPRAQSSSSSELAPVSRKRSHSTSKKSDGESTNEPPHPKKSKQIRKCLQQDTDTNSPVSGMYIKDLSEISEADLAKAAELDETASCVHVSEESRRAIAEIPNVIGDSVCSLCKVKFEDVFRLAMHKCPRIVHEEYRCPECSKVFSCPANLASHRRWHSPKPKQSPANNNTKLQSTPSPSLSSIQTTSSREASPEMTNLLTSELALQLFGDSFLSAAKHSDTDEEEVVVDVGC